MARHLVRHHLVQRASEPLIYLWLFFLITPPAAAVGAFLNHPLLGFICGAASGIAVALWAAVVD